ncbi:hypothetical protein PV327_001676 [Microctonus hyperodae]|uniref:Uncharacterized protein n=1 Tax=Microctonus hyperodae TaxID=165561 RepID=A0AA39KNG6_MICHY|nr:hypothetical protein PV327_001676 [Microctonus hyperodae]
MLADTLNDLNESTDDSLDKENLPNDTSSSYCTSCQEELNNLNPVPLEKVTQLSSEPNNFDNLFAPAIEKITEPEAVESINETARSLSRISLEFENHQEEIINNEHPSDINLQQNLFLNTFNEDILIEILEDNTELHQVQSQKNTGKQFCDKEVQTDPQDNEVNDPWDPEFPSAEIDLQKIDATVENIAVTNSKNLKKKNKSNIQDNSNNNIKFKKITKPNYNSISSILLNRQKRLAHLSNDMYQFSSYLDGIRKALLAKEPPPVMPSPPAMTGYDSQFDFPNENRFEKLPIIIESSKTTSKSMSALVNSNSESSRLGSGSSKSSSKRTNNGENELAPKRFMHRPANKETLHSDKENKNNEKSKKSISDSTSMYSYNPLSNRLKKKS